MRRPSRLGHLLRQGATGFPQAWKRSSYLRMSAFVQQFKTIEKQCPDSPVVFLILILLHHHVASNPKKKVYANFTPHLSFSTRLKSRLTPLPSQESEGQRNHQTLYSPALRVCLGIVSGVPWLGRCGHTLNFTKGYLFTFTSEGTHLCKRMATGIVNGFWYLSSVSSQRVVRS